MRTIVLEDVWRSVRVHQIIMAGIWSATSLVLSIVLSFMLKMLPGLVCKFAPMAPLLMASIDVVWPSARICSTEMKDLHLFVSISVLLLFMATMSLRLAFRFVPMGLLEKIQQEYAWRDVQLPPMLILISTCVFLDAIKVYPSMRMTLHRAVSLFAHLFQVFMERT